MAKAKPQALLASLSERYIRESATTALATTHALLFHCASRQLQLITCHRVVEDAGRAPVIAAGRPLTPGDEREILDLLTTRQSANACSLDLYPATLLHADPTRTLWWEPSAVRPMHLRGIEQSQTILTRWPTLVLLARDRQLFLAALPDDERPTGDTPLFHAPLPNVYASTMLCTGDATLPREAGIAAMVVWQSVLFDSAFTHANHHGNLKPTRSAKSGDVQDYWAGREADVTPFPFQRLMPLGQTLAQWYSDPKGKE
jgi:PRTRC genetic system protein B